MEQDVILASESWVNAGGLILITVGICILIAEIFLPSYGLFAFSGITAILIGIIQLHQTGYIEELPIKMRTLSTMAGFGVLMMFFAGRQLMKVYRKNNTTGAEAMIGQHAWILTWREKKGRIRVKATNEDWQGYSDTEFKLKRGDHVMVTKVDGLRLKIKLQDSET